MTAEREAEREEAQGSELRAQGAGGGEEKSSPAPSIWEATVARPFTGSELDVEGVTVVKVASLQPGDHVRELQAEGLVLKAIYVGTETLSPSDLSSIVVLPERPVALALKNEGPEPRRIQGALFVVPSSASSKQAPKQVADAEIVSEERKTATPKKNVSAVVESSPKSSPAALSSIVSRGNPRHTPVGGGELEVTLTRAEAASIRDALRGQVPNLMSLSRASRALEHVISPEERPAPPTVDAGEAVVVRTSRARMHLARDVLRGRVPHPLEMQGADWDFDQVLKG